MAKHITHTSAQIAAGGRKHVTVATHNGEFHADDAFAVAVLDLSFEKTGQEYTVVRSRDPEIIQTADYVLDVGGVYDEASNHFDHHQTGGAGKRPNDIPYATFGLVWKKFGEMVAGSKGAAEIIDERLVAPTDATDNGVSVSKEIFKDVRPYDVSAVIGAMNPNWNEFEAQGNINQTFLEAVALAKKILVREIKSVQAVLESEKFVIKAYQDAPDKRIVILDGDYPFGDVIMNFAEPLFVIYPKDGKWRAKAVRRESNSFANRKDFPVTWAGKRGEELERLTGVTGSIFCHAARFLAVAETKDAALALVKIAVDA